MRMDLTDLVHDLQHGFPFIDVLPKCEAAADSVPPKPLGELSMQDVFNHRRTANEILIDKVSETEWAQDVMTETLKDVEHGAMTRPVLVDELNLDEVTLTRRLPVREERSKGWRTRIVDHATESLLNLSTYPQDKVSHDTVDVFMFILLQFLAALQTPKCPKQPMTCFV